MTIVTTDLIVIGGGEHARVVCDAALSRPGVHRVVGFIDRTRDENAEALLGVPWLGDDSVIARLHQAHAILAVGATSADSSREDLLNRVAAYVRDWAVVIHRTAVVAPSANIGPGSVILAGAIVQPCAYIGRHCIVNTGAIIEHDCQVEDFSIVGPGAIVGGGARLGRGSYVALGACVRDHRAVGRESTVGMGAVVVADITAGVTAIGCPARPINASEDEASR